MEKGLRPWNGRRPARPRLESVEKEVLIVERRTGHTARGNRRRGIAMLTAACAALGALVGIIVIPQHFSDAAATAVSTIYTTGSNTSNGTTAASADAPTSTRR